MRAPPRLQKFKDRIIGLLNYSTLTQAQYDDVQRISCTLQKISYSDGESQEIITELRIQVAGLLDKPIQAISAVPSVEMTLTKRAESGIIEISPQNQDMQVYLVKLMRICTHAVSSTKK
jgi:hypothetical protein